MTPRTQLLMLEAARDEFTFHPGQAVWLRRPDAPERKPYSIANAPADLASGDGLEFLIALEEDGRPGTHLGELAIGSPIEVEGPLGGFDLPASVPFAPVLLVGGGTGIAPLRSMWRQLQRDAEGSRVSLIYSARRSDEIAFLDELTRLADEGAMKVGITITGEDADWSSLRGRVTAELLASHLESPDQTRCAICGPVAFVAHVGQTLLRLGVPPAHIATERW